MNFYFEAAGVLDRIDSKQGSIKGIISNLPEKDRKRTAALVIDTLKYKSVLSTIVQQTNLLKEERKKITSQNLAFVLIHDLLLAKGIQAGDGPIKQAVLRHKTRLNAEFQKIKIKKGIKSNSELAQAENPNAAQIPRYVRVNTLMWTIEEAIESYNKCGFTVSFPFSSDHSFAVDDHIPNLLKFPPRTSFQEDDAYKRGRMILQDKASCFPAVVLDPPALDDAVVIDATAAPGNKTSHLSAIMCNKGKLYALERDTRRFATLRSMVTKAGCTNVIPMHADFLSLNPEDPEFARATHILLDPSCSGSGIVNRLDYLLEAEDDSLQDQARLEKLAMFQLKMIKHAMKFPQVQKIVYSTCSVNAIENEHVVSSALDATEAQKFVLAPEVDVLPNWPRRGLADELGHPEYAGSLLRCQAGEDLTNGFFVSCFIRRKDGGDSGNTGTKRKKPIVDHSENLAQRVNQPKRKKQKQESKTKN